MQRALGRTRAARLRLENIIRDPVSSQYEKNSAERLRQELITSISLADGDDFNEDFLSKLRTIKYFTTTYRLKKLINNTNIDNVDSRRAENMLQSLRVLNDRVNNGNLDEINENIEMLDNGLNNSENFVTRINLAQGIHRHKKSRKGHHKKSHHKKSHHKKSHKRHHKKTHKKSHKRHHRK
tara:strand:- start:246 stop:788 length:543 start_codon:yes stop_codon:yes gene_type:complete